MNADSLDIRLLRFRARRDEAPHVLGQALFDAGRFAEALEVAQIGLIDLEDDVRLMVLEGRAAFEQGDLPQAQAALLRVVKQHPREKEGFRWLAQVLMKRGEPGRAVQVLDRALAIEPGDKQLQQARARAERLWRIAQEAGDSDAEPTNPAAAPQAIAPPVAPPAMVPPAVVPPPLASRAPANNAAPVRATLKGPAVPPPPSVRGAAQTARPIVQEPALPASAFGSAEPRAASRSAEPRTLGAEALAPDLGIDAYGRTEYTSKPADMEPAARSREPMRVEPPAQPASRSREPVRMEPPAQPASRSREPLSLEPAQPAARSREPLAVPPAQPASRSREPVRMEPERPASASRSAKPMQALAPSRAPEESFDTQSETLPPQKRVVDDEILAAFEHHDDDDLGAGLKADDDPTSAFEMPPDMREWLENERSGKPTKFSGFDDSEEDEDDPEPTVMRSAQEVFAEVGEAAKRPGASTATPLLPQSTLESILVADDVRATQSNERDIDTETVDFAGLGALVTGERAEPLEPAQPAALTGGDSAQVAEPEPPEQVLSLLEQQGIYEKRPEAAREDWVSKREAPRAGNRLGKSLAVGWVLALAAAGGGYYGFNYWLQMRKGEARTMITRAAANLEDGQYESLLAAERALFKAREADPKSLDATEMLLYVHATRALEDATGDVGYLRASLARAEQVKAKPALVAAGKALIAAYDRNAAAAQAEASKALKLGGDDARVLYLIGRLYQRSGRPEAGELLAKATTLDPSLSLAWLAQAEIARQEGELEKAEELLQKSLGSDHAQLRAELWSIVLAGGEQPDALAQRLDGLAGRIKRGAASDKLLAGIARAGVEVARGNLDAARDAVKAAAQVPVQDPELMSLLGERAATVGEHDLAYRAANGAMLAAPSVRRYRDALANVLLKRGDGRAVLSALEGVEGDGSWLHITRARAALLAGSRDALEQSKKALAAYRETEAGKDDVDAAALLVRTDLRLGANPESLLTAARSLANKAPSSSMARLALGEIAVAAGQGELALTALQKAAKLAPEDADVHTLLGRAYRLTGKPAEAQASLERALALAPSHMAAREALGSLLLDRGEYERALKLFTSIERDRGGIAATFGAIEARLGAGDLAGAEKALDALDPGQRGQPAGQLLVARLALAKNRPNDAVRVLEPLVDEESETRTAEVLSLYGDALYQADRVDSAAGAYDAALELDPSLPEALVGRAMAAVRAEKVNQAYELLEQAKIALTTRARSPRVQANLLITFARADILKENFARAKAMLSEAIALPHVPTEAHFWYGETLAKTKTPGAAESYMRYIELDPHGYYAERAKRALAPR